MAHSYCSDWKSVLPTGDTIKKYLLTSLMDTPSSITSCAVEWSTRTSCSEAASLTVGKDITHEIRKLFDIINQRSTKGILITRGCAIHYKSR